MLVGLFVGCSGKEVDESNPAALFKEAEEEAKSDRYQMAIDKFRIVKNKFPYSKESIEAQLRIADIYFMQESYPEAAASYETFRDLHPKHEKTPYAMFRIAKSYFSDLPGTVARDLTTATKALEAYNDFVKRFPGAPEVADAQKDVGEIRKTLAEKELYIAEFYLKRSHPESAQPRLKKIVEMYPETAAAKEAQNKLGTISGRTKESK